MTIISSIFGYNKSHQRNKIIARGYNINYIIPNQFEQNMTTNHIASYTILL